MSSSPQPQAGSASRNKVTIHEIGFIRGDYVNAVVLGKDICTHHDR